MYPTEASSTVIGSAVSIVVTVIAVTIISGTIVVLLLPSVKLFLLFTLAVTMIVTVTVGLAC